MKANDIDCDYLKIQRLAADRFGNGRGNFIYPIKILKLLNLLAGGEHIERCLIPNAGQGELALCADEADVYSKSVDVVEIIEKSGCGINKNIVNRDFLNTDIVGAYSTIILCPVFGARIDRDRSEELYINKSLDLLEENGRLVMLVPQSLLSVQAFKELRKRILRDFSLEAVISMRRVLPFSTMELSALVIEKKIQSEKIYMLMNSDDPENAYEEYSKGSSGFYVDSSEVYERFDPNYFDPDYKEVRELIQRRDTIKLGDIADILYGCMINSENRLEKGDYQIINSAFIHEGAFANKHSRVAFCSKEFVASDRRASRCVLQNGDVIISTISSNNVDWAVFHGEDDYYIANQHVAIIRGKQEYEEWLKLFFSTKTGVEYLESQLDFISHCGRQLHISCSNLAEIFVPDIKVMKTADSMQHAVDEQARAVMLFKELGWTVEEWYRKGRHSFDIALFDNGILRGVVEVKEYRSSQVVNSHRMADYLGGIRADIQNAHVYLFVDNELYEYDEGELKQLLELPRPGSLDAIKKKDKEEKKENKGVLSVEKVSVEESSVSDRLLIEMLRDIKDIRREVHNISDKIDQLSKQISGFQSLVDKQLDIAASIEEEEHILHAFTEECVERIVKEVNASNSEKEFNTERNNLIESLGESAWNKLDESSKTFLISSKVTFNDLEGLENVVDYSGVCLLVTKALENEMSKRFCKGFIDFLKQQYPGKVNYPQYPSALLDRHGKPIKPKHFTLGSVAYVLCRLEDDKLSEEIKENNRRKLLEYSREKIFSEKTDDEIVELLNDYADSIEEVKNDYRNPSAHTNELRKVDAEQCFDLVLDVEKLLKRMLDSFNV
ncbi:restriction endonuclease subunit S [Butyrivibrio sp. AE3009]|uniref:restriction endonuclease subunit S n=1 Tax=Butyrivibrio sp. AE3009 TaxID=1280666 RepID=UPI0003B3F875|nr:restriction endonuclease subunit S [Butyrivibrio sp. AE3009]